MREKSKNKKERKLTLHQTKKELKKYKLKI